MSACDTRIMTYMIRRSRIEQCTMFGLLQNQEDNNDNKMGEWEELKSIKNPNVNYIEFIVDNLHSPHVFACNKHGRAMYITLKELNNVQKFYYYLTLDFNDLASTSDIRPGSTAYAYDPSNMDSLRLIQALQSSIDQFIHFNNYGEKSGFIQKDASGQIVISPE